MAVSFLIKNPRFGAIPAPANPIETRRLERYRNGLDTFVRTQHDPYRLIVLHDDSGQIPLRETLHSDWAESMEKQIGKLAKILEKGGLHKFDDFEYGVVDAYCRCCRRSENGIPRRQVEQHDTFGVSAYGRRYHDKAMDLMNRGIQTQYQFTLPLAGVGEIPMCRLEFLGVGSGVEVTPANPQYREALYKELSRLFDETLSLKPVIDAENKKPAPHLDPLLDKAVETIARFHWVFAQTMPYKRGSAGVADTMTKTMFEYLGIAVPRWQEGIRPDLEAMTTPLEEFVKEYPETMAYPPAFYNRLR